MPPSAGWWWPWRCWSMRCSRRSPGWQRFGPITWARRAAGAPSGDPRPVPRPTGARRPGFSVRPAPDFLLTGLIQPANDVLVGHTVDLSFSLWHGFTPMLALSATVVAFAGGLLAYWHRIHYALSLNTGLKRSLGDAGYNAVFTGTLRPAERCTRLLQNGDQHRYTATVATAVLLIIGYGVLASGTRPVFSLGGGRFDLPTAVVLLMMCLGALAATRTPSLLRAMIAVGVVGFGSALVFLLNGAPDVALTQFSVEVLLVLIWWRCCSGCRSVRLRPAGRGRNAWVSCSRWVLRWWCSLPWLPPWRCRWTDASPNSMPPPATGGARSQRGQRGAGGLPRHRHPRRGGGGGVRRH